MKITILNGEMLENLESAYRFLRSCAYECVAPYVEEQIFPKLNKYSKKQKENKKCQDPDTR